MTSTTKFALRTPKGLAKLFLAASSIIPALTKANPPPGHVIFIVDRSGSMYGDMPSVRECLDKLNTAADMTSLPLVETLISYSSSGDVTLHYQGVPISKAANDPACVRAVKELQATCLTSPSQAMRIALDIVKKASGEAVTVLLHTDGYANDPGVRSEQQACMELAKQMAALGAVVSTIAHRDWSDFTALSQIAAAGGGSCMRAPDNKGLYKALADTASAAAGRTIPTFRQPLGDADIAVAVDYASKRVVMARKPEKELVLQGLSEAPTIYMFKDVGEAGFTSASCAENADPVPALALALAAINANDKVTYQRALVGSQVEQVQGHWRAVSAADAVAATEALESALFSGGALTLRANPGVVSAGPSLTDLLTTMAEHRGSILVDVQALRSGYKTRSLRRVAGTMGEDGVVVPFPYKQRADARWANLNSVDVNRSSPNVNLNLRRDAKLIEVDAKGKQVREIDEVAGIPLASQGFSEFKNYTIVGEGSVYIKALTIRILDKQAHAALRDLGISVGDFSPSNEVVIDVSNMAVVGDEPEGNGLDEATLKDLFLAQMLEKALSGFVDGESAKYDAATLEALSKFGISGGLYFSAPTVNPYAHLSKDKKEALKLGLSKGIVDTRVTYSVSVGIRGMADPSSELMSANKFLARRFAREDMLDKKGKEKLDPKMSDVAAGVKMVEKDTGRITLGLVDDLAFPLFKDLLGQGNGKTLRKAVAWCERDSSEVEALVSTLTTAIKSGNRDAVTSAAFKMISVVRRAVENFYRRYVSPVVLFAGATGTIPAAMTGKSVTAEDLEAMGTKLSKDMSAEGIFFLTDKGVLISVLAEQVYYTPSAKDDAEAA